MKAVLGSNVKRVNRKDVMCGSFRVGTLREDRDRVVECIDVPSPVHADGKVTVEWVFSCPRGFFSVRDYWWNAPGEWSIVAHNDKQGLWARAYLRSLGMNAKRS